MLINWVNRDTCDKAFNFTKGTIYVGQLPLIIMVSPYLDCILMNSYEFIESVIETGNIVAFLVRFITGWLEYFTFAFIHTPHNKHVIVFGPTNCDQVIAITIEG